LRGIFRRAGTQCLARYAIVSGLAARRQSMAANRVVAVIFKPRVPAGFNDADRRIPRQASCGDWIVTVGLPVTVRVIEQGG